MLCTFCNTFYAALICHVLLAKAKHVYMKTDLFCLHKDHSINICLKDDIGLGVLWDQPTHTPSKKNVIEMASGSGEMGFFRPRSALARALYEKHRTDLHLEQIDKTEWYQVDSSQLSPELNSKFVQLGPDEETKEFLSASIEKSSWVWMQIWYLLAKAVLKHFWSITDINGWLGRGSMFVLSHEHARAMLASERDCAGALVDVGAGDGEVSRRFAGLYARKYATEISASMRKTLTKKGYTLLDIDDWWRTQQFECVCMLNLLDRCSKPKTMLQQAKAALAPDGILLLALVLPFKPYVEVTPNHKPEERLPIEGATFEEQVASFVAFMSGLGFQLVTWARAPYLCEGDFAQAYYWLDDSVYVFKSKPIQDSPEGPSS